MKVRKPLFGAISMICLLAALCSGQVSTGLPAHASFASTPAGTVNLGNLNIHLSVPILQKAGRGISFSYSAMYDSAVWYPVTVSGSATWTPASYFGWTMDAGPTLGFMKFKLVSSRGGKIYCDDGTQTYNTIATYSNYIYLDKFGIAHSFSGTATRTWSSCGNDTIVGFTALAADGSGYSLDTTTNWKGILTSNRGMKLAVPYVLGSSGTGTGGSITDTNGNYISVTNGVFTDTLGTTVLTATDGASGAPTTFTYTAPSGASATAQLTYLPYSVKTAFNCSGIGEYSQSVYLVDKLQFADGTYYQFQYEPTPSQSGFVTGRISSVRLPTGGGGHNRLHWGRLGNGYCVC